MSDVVIPPLSAEMRQRVLSAAATIEPLRKHFHYEGDWVLPIPENPNIDDLCVIGRNLDPSRPMRFKPSSKPWGRLLAFAKSVIAYGLHRVLRVGLKRQHKFNERLMVYAYRVQLLERRIDELEKKLKGSAKP